jgi:Receptor family ligand binding region
VELATSAIGGLGVHGIIGAHDDTISKAMAFVCNDYDLSQVAYGAKEAELGSGSEFPNFVRVFPSDGYEAYAMADLIGKTFGWARVVAVYTTDFYGSIALKMFQYRASQLGISTVFQLALTPGQAVTNETLAQLEQQISAVGDVDGRIWALLTDDLGQVQNFFYMAQGILSADTYFVGNSYISVPELFSDPRLSDEYMRTILAGYIGIQDATSDWMVTPAGKSFISRIRSLPATQSNGVCSEATDDSGLQKIYHVPLSDGTLGCAGMNYSTFAADGSNLSPYAGYMYDAIYLMVMGIIEYSRRAHTNPDGSWYIPTKINGGQLSDALVQYTAFNGTTGLVELSFGISQVIVLLRPPNVSYLYS